MYFWKIDRLKAELATGPMNSRAAIPYLLVTLAIYELIYLLEPMAREDEWDYATDIAGVVALVAGTIYVYFQNGAAEGRDFLSRYFALGWVYGVRFFVCAIPLYIVLTFLIQGIMPEAEYSEIESRWFFHSSVALQAFFYWRMGAHFKDLAGLKETAPLTREADA
jgi:hypothetical protein